MKKILSLLLLSLCFFPAYVQAISLDAEGLLNDARVSSGFEEANETTFAQNLGTVVMIAMSFLGILFTALIVYAGFNWMIARGDEEKVSKAMDTIRASIIGLIIVLAAYSISYFVTNALL